MPGTLSVMSMHLRYRLWIAEMNADINVLRIFEDYMHELADKKQVREVITGIEYFREQFMDLRKEIDELRHEMHLEKMQLAAAAKKSKETDQKISFKETYAALKKRYLDFRKTFNSTKKEFEEFEGNWLN